MLSREQTALVTLEPRGARRARTRATVAGIANGANSGLFSLAVSVANPIAGLGIMVLFGLTRPMRTWLREIDRNATARESQLLKAKARTRILRRLAGIESISRLDRKWSEASPAMQHDLFAIDASRDAAQTWTRSRITIASTLIAMGFVSWPLALVCGAGLYPIWKAYEKKTKQALVEGDRENRSRDKYNTAVSRKLTLQNLIDARQGGDENWEELTQAIEGPAESLDQAINEKRRMIGKGAVLTSIAYADVGGPLRRTLCRHRAHAFLGDPAHASRLLGQYGHLLNDRGDSRARGSGCSRQEVIAKASRAFHS